MQKLTFVIFLGLLLFSAGAGFGQETGRDKGIAMYKAGDLKGAAKNLKEATKKNPSDAISWYYLGLSLLSDNKRKDAETAFETAVSLDGKVADFHTGLAFASLFRNKLERARVEARAALAIDPKQSNAEYILGVVAARSGDYKTALEKANGAIALRKDFESAYLLKSEMLVSIFTSQTPPAANSPENRGELLVEAAAALEKYLELNPKAPDSKFYRKYITSIQFFAKYYADRAESEKGAAENVLTPLKILAKPRPAYTDEARTAGIQGVIRLLVGFSENGTIEHVLVVSPLGFGLDREAVKAVSNIKFEPAKRNGVPVSIVRMIEYSFTIY